MISPYQRMAELSAAGRTYALATVVRTHGSTPQVIGAKLIVTHEEGERPFGTLGSARQHPTLGHVNDVRVMSDARPVEAGTVGELELRNPAIMRGYYEMPDETAAVMQDGWLRTGDLVTANADHTYTFIGRKKEVLRRQSG